jgi:hypothetical protein
MQSAHKSIDTEQNTSETWGFDLCYEGFRFALIGWTTVISIMSLRTEADSATTAKTPVCTLHLTLRTLHVALENQNLIINDSIDNA